MTSFGLQIEPSFGFSYEDVAGLARSLRPNGFNSMWASDHFMLNDGEPDRDCLECWTLLTAIAVEVKDIRIGPLVTCASYRNPALLAKMAASLDRVSGGRLEFGIGAGWKDVEYQAYGYRFPSAGERVSQLEEAVQIIKSLWTEPVTTFDGKYHSVKSAVAAPKPVQAPHPPVLIGGSRPRMLRIMARYADTVNFVPQPDVKAYAETLASLEEICSEEGRDFDRIRKTHFLTMLIGADDAGVQARLERVARRDGMSPDEWRSKRSRAFVGTTGEAQGLLKRYTELGVTQFMVVFPYKEEAESIKLFADDIVGRV
ncbi:MAG: TIGR03560 family F420-dependent LLM class oxidoreductase [Chloroflexi bacterium]|nr:TIGR03560 family F420-dependent LLM class oxidoreductase [Chloroflexota bacterium]